MPALAPLTNDELSALLARARQGDQAAVEPILVHVAPAIQRFGLRMCKNVHDAEDVLQDTLLNIAKHLGEFEGRSSLSSWVFSLTRSACARKRRGLKNRPPVSDEHVAEQPDLAPNPEARAAQQELGSALSCALDGLSDDQREVILLRDVEGLSAPEAASSLGISVDALKSRLHRAREALRNALRPLLEPTAAPARAGCPDVIALWSQKLEGDLSQADCSAMERHIANCLTCHAACDALKRALLACQNVRAEEVPPELQARVRAAIESCGVAARASPASGFLAPCDALEQFFFLMVTNPRRRAAQPSASHRGRTINPGSALSARAGPNADARVLLARELKAPEHRGGPKFSPRAVLRKPEIAQLRTIA